MVEHKSYAPTSSLNEYSQMVRAYNIVLQQQLKSLLNQAPLPDDACIAVVGSHGKQEGTPYSKPEIMVVLESDPEVPVTHHLSNWYDATYGKHSFSSDFDLPSIGNPECKVIAKGHLSTAFYELELPPMPQYYPDRVLNASNLVGNPKTLSTARRVVLDEIGNRGSSPRKIRSHMSRQVKDYKKAAIEGSYMSRPIFDGLIGQQYYDLSENLSTGFKIPFLRLTQRRLDLACANLVKNDIVSSDWLSLTLPTSTVEKIEFMNKEGLCVIDPSVTEAYQWFLREYHRVQSAFYLTHSESSTSFSEEDFARHKEVLLNFTPEL